ncbi:MAG: Uma2 family endonuclease [Deltaproteobacteria bacterium]|nr:Uma2 family endonuclease [Deltaproteobacteria bacterium]
MASPPRAPAYAEWLALGEGVRAEIVGERVVVLPRPMPADMRAELGLGRFIGGPFHHDHGRGGPGGWYLFPEVDVRFASGDLVVPDLSGWRRERLPVPNVRPLEVVPDWVCETTSPSNERHDRLYKSRLYARHGVGHYWLVDPALRMLEAYALQGDGRWLQVGAWDEDETARIEPFEAVELEVGRLFLPRSDLGPPVPSAPHPAPSSSGSSRRASPSGRMRIPSTS